MAASLRILIIRDGICCLTDMVCWYVSEDNREMRIIKPRYAKVEQYECM